MEYLRYMCSDTPKEWSQWLPRDEWCTNFHNTIHTTSYEIVFGLPPPAYLPYLLGESNIELVDRSLQKREEIFRLLKLHMKRAQERMKQLVDKDRTDRKFQIGGRVYVKLQSYRQVWCLGWLFFGPLLNVDCVAPVAYKLELPA